MMKETVNNQLDAELAHAGEETALSPKMLLLEELRITPEKELRPMDFLFRLFGKSCFPRRELVGITGKAKSGKTFVVSDNPSEEGKGTARQEKLPPLNQAYRVYDENGKGTFDVPRLFNDALQGECEVRAQVYRERVMQLSGIAIPFKYNQLLNEALKQKVIIKVQKDKLTYYQAAPF